MKKNTLVQKIKVLKSGILRSVFLTFIVPVGLIISSTASAYSGEIAPPLPFGTIGKYAPCDFYPVDVTTDKEGNIYTADFFYATVSRYGADGSLQLVINDPALNPRRIALDNDGHIYVSTPSANTVRVYSGTGDLEGVWSIPDLGEGGIEFVPPDRLYMALTRTGQIGVFDTGGSELFRFGSEGRGPGEFIAPLDVDVSDSGEIYVADKINHRIQKFDSNGNFITIFGKRGSLPGEFFKPVAISIDSLGNFFVTDRNNARVQKFDSDGNLLTIWGSKGTEDGQFKDHHGIAVAPDDTVWVAGFHGHDIQHFGNDGTFIERWQGHVSGPGEFANVRGMTVVDGKLFVVDNENQRVQAFDATSGDYLYEFGERGGGEDTVFNFPKSITAGPTGDLYIGDDADIRRIKQDGTFVKRYPPLPGSRAGSRGLAVSSAGILFQSDVNNHRIIKRNTNTKEVLLTWGEFGSAPGEFNRPSGIALGPDETLYVADTQNKRIQRFTQNGDFIQEWDTIPENSNNPVGTQGLAIDPERGLLYAGSSSKAILAYNLEGEFLFSWDYSGSGIGDVGFPMRLSVSPRGIVYSTDGDKVNRYIFIHEDLAPGIPSYTGGYDGGIFLWKDTFDGPYHLRVSGDGSRKVYDIRLVSSEPLLQADGIGLEGTDQWQVSGSGFNLIARLSGGQDGADFALKPGARALMAIETNGKTYPKHVLSGGTAELISLTGWLIPAEQLPPRPSFITGEDLGLFIGGADFPDIVEARLSGNGPAVSANLDFFSSRALSAVTGRRLEPSDILDQKAHSVVLHSFLGPKWDGVDITLSSDGETDLGVFYEQDGLPAPHFVNPGLGELNAFRIPAPQPYEQPEYDPSSEERFFIWKGDDQVWRLRGTAGNSTRRYAGTITSSLPFTSVNPYSIESGEDILNTSGPYVINFHFTVRGSSQDGIDLSVPDEAEIQLMLDRPVKRPARFILIGKDRWPVENLPLELWGW